MAFIPVINVAQVEIRYYMGTTRMENTLYFYRADGITVPDLVALTTAIGNWWNSWLRTIQRQGLYIQEIFARDLTTETSPAYADTSRNGQQGADATNPILPLNVSVVCSFRTGVPGRSYRGRNYAVGVSGGAITGTPPTVQSGWRTNMRTAYQKLLAGGGALPAGWVWVVVSRYTGGAPRATGVATAIIDVPMPDAFFDSQRRRLPKL